MVAIRGAEMADSIDLTGGDVGADPQSPSVEARHRTREVTALDIDVLRTRLELLHDMADDDRRDRESLRAAVHAGLTELAQAMRDIQRDHRGIRQTLGDLANIVNRQMAEGSALRATLDDLRAAVLEVREEGRTAVQQTQRDTRRGFEQLEAHARTDRDWIGATQAHVERLAGDLARQAAETAVIREALDRADAELVRQRSTELEHIALVREQLVEAMAEIEALGAGAKRQAAQITRLRADMKPAPAAPARKAAAKKAPAKTATKAVTKRTSRSKPSS